MIKDPSRNRGTPVSSALKVVIVGELALLVGAFACFQRMKYSRDFRYKCYKIWPRSLDGYYWCISSANKEDQRRLDYDAWGIPLPEEKS